jgi:hypothetical protein
MKMQIALNDLANAACPTSHSDWGSERQVEAQNEFFLAVEKILTDDEFEKLESYCLKASTEEMIDSAMLRVSENLLARLTREYETWNKAQGLNLGSADEHLFDENLTETQRGFVQRFCRRWENSLTRGNAGGVRLRGDEIEIEGV